MKLFLIFVSVILFFQGICLKGDSLIKKQIGVSCNPVVFVDYPGFATAPGLDFNFFGKYGRASVEAGVLGGNSFPLFNNLNYYVGAGFNPLSTRTKYEINLKTKLMVSHYESEGLYINTVHDELSLLLGLSYTRKFKRFVYGVESYAWWSNYEYNNTHTRLTQPNQPETHYAGTGFANTILFVFKLSYLLKTNY